MAARKTYCFTYNNYTGPLEVALQNFLVANCDFAVYGREVAPTTGTPHLQVYMTANYICDDYNACNLSLLI